MRAAAVALTVGAASFVSGAKPNVLFIVSDDLGFNDISKHGSKQIPTPHVDSICDAGVTLMNYHVQPVCSPSRSTFMSGRHVIHTGIYMPFSQGTSLRLNLTYTLLPAYLKKLGYSTHMVGKWHLGQNVMAALPTGRGFDTYFGYWSGAEDYYTHECKNAYDLNNDTVGHTTAALEYKGNYSTPLFTAEAVRVIEKYGGGASPIFLYLAYQNVHWPLEAPDAYVEMFANTTGNDHKRNMVCAMAKIMDDGIGEVLGSLKRAGIFDTTLVIFSSDNGGPTNGNEGTSSNNYPMRGGKNTIWEGGTRVVGCVSGDGVRQKNAVSYELFHASDWLPTIVSMANGGDWKTLIPDSEPAYLLGDGINSWSMFSAGQPSARTEMVLETHPDLAGQEHGNGFIVGDMKILKLGQTHPADEAGWHPPPGQDPKSTTYLLGCPPPPAGEPDKNECVDDWCLFNITADPCEHNDLSKQMAQKVTDMQARLRDYAATAVPPVRGEGCNPVVADNGAWRPCDAPPEMLARTYL